MKDLTQLIAAILLSSIVATVLTYVATSRAGAGSNLPDDPVVAPSNTPVTRPEAQPVHARNPQPAPSAYSHPSNQVDHRNAKVATPRSHREPLPNNSGTSRRLPSDDMQVRLIKNALITLNNANVTGNYSVLRDLCSPALREEKKASDFAMAFRKARDRNRDMSLVMGLKPIPSRPPTLSPDGRMRLAGFFPTQPLVLHYELVLLNSDRGDWWIDGIVVRTQPANLQASPAEPPPADESQSATRLPSTGQHDGFDKTSAFDLNNGSGMRR